MQIKWIMLLVLLICITLTDENYAPGEVVIRFERGVVNLPIGEQKGDVNTIMDTKFINDSIFHTQ